jgi:DNA-binding transcriptional regulator YiaG
VQILAGELGGAVAEAMKETARDNDLSIVEIEQLFGLHEDEDDAPAPLDAAPSPEREGNLPTITAPPVSEGLTAIRRGRSGWPERDSQGNPRFVFERDRPYEVKGQFNVIVPKDNRAFQAAEAEMAQKVLRSFGHRTARLMLACSAHAAHPDDEQDKPTPIPGKRIREWLGVDRQTRPDLPRHKRDQICFDEIERLSRVGVQINVLSNIQEDGWADYDRLRRLQPVWHLNIHEHGQVRVMDGETRAENWQLLVEPSAWGKLYVYNDTGRQFGYFSRALLENIDWHRNPEGGDLAIELLKFNRFQRGRPKDLTVGRMLEICQLDGADSSTKRHRKRKKLEQAILEQERWGWNVDWTRWPDAYRPDNDGRPSFPRGYWKGKTKDGWKCSFHNWKVTFYPPEDMGALNSRAEKIDNSDPHELEPKGWPDRIRAILDATNYSQAGVARELEVSQAAVSFWKSGEQTPSPEHQAKLRDIERRHGVRDD